MPLPEFAPAVVEEARGKLNLTLPQLKGLTLSRSAALGAMFAHLALRSVGTSARDSDPYAERD